MTAQPKTEFNHLTSAGTQPALVITYRAVADLIPYARNARTHSPRQLEQLADSMREFGWTNPVLVDGQAGIIAGHGRVLAAELAGVEFVPTIELSHLTPEQVRAYVIADNKLAMNAGWDMDILAEEIQALDSLGADLTLIGFDNAEIEELLNWGEEEEEEEDGDGADAAPDLEDEAVTRPGDVWILGHHRVMCGDARSHSDVARLCAGRTAQLLHADPPYGMGKEADGVANDNIYGAKLDEFQMEWWAAFRPHLDDNASAYVWGNAPDLWRLWYAGGLADSEPMALRNEIVWDKKSIPGMASPDLTQFPEASERCLFFQLGRFVFRINQTKEDYWQGWEPVRLYLCEQRDLAGFKAGDVKEICGNHMYGHWFSTSQWSFISRESYQQLHNASGGVAFARPYDELHAEYKDLQAVFNGDVRDGARSEFNAARPFFDNAHDVMRDVWEFSRVNGEEQHGHATPKPVDMMKRIMRSSAREGGIVLEPFGGTGSTLIGAERTGRICYTIEMVPQYVDVIVKRWQAITNDKAIRESDRVPFDDAA